MMKALLDPLLPSDVDLRSMPFMPVYVERLRRSRGMLRAQTNPAAGFAMVLLWLESWGEFPAGSLENDDEILTAIARCNVAEWEDRRHIALHGWVACNDGRLYHPVICEIAWGVWLDRLKMLHERERDRIAKANKRHIGATIRPEQSADVVSLKPQLTFDEWVEANYPATAAKLAALKN